jgi:hypothetical protein
LLAIPDHDVAPGPLTRCRVAELPAGSPGAVQLSGIVLRRIRLVPRDYHPPWNDIVPAAAPELTHACRRASELDLGEPEVQAPYNHLVSQKTVPQGRAMTSCAVAS